jgi:uncharacterized protein (DUF433 family)
LNLPSKLKKQAERCAVIQGITLEMFVLLTLAEKVGILNQPEEDSNFSNIIYRRRASGQMQPIIKNTGLRVQTLVIASNNWGLSVSEIADNYEIAAELVEEALAFYRVHQQEVDDLIIAEAALESIYQ